MGRVIVSVTNDLVTDQRVHRTCTALTEAGWEVRLVGRKLKGSPEVVREYETERMRLVFRKKALFYAEYNIRLFVKLLLARVDVIYANDTDTLLASWMVARLRGKALFFDAHEMFPEVPELVGRKRIKAVWRGIEDLILPRIASSKKMGAATVCESIAEIYEKRYGLKMAVVRNVPMRRENKSLAESAESVEKGNEKRMLLYQGAVNVGRGIEWVMSAMRYLPEYDMVVAGVGDEYERLRKEGEEIGNVTFLGRMEPEELHRLTPKAKLGLSLLENRGLNYYYSLPNRIADFVQAGVPVLATDFPEIHRVVEGYGIGRLIAPSRYIAEEKRSEAPDARELAEEIRKTVEWWESIPEGERQRRMRQAAEELSWEKDKEVLLTAFGEIAETTTSDDV